MRYGNRLFPYPVLNNTTEFTGFTNSSFTLVFELQESEDFYILKGAHYVLKNDHLANLISIGKIAVCCVVECSNTVYRGVFPLTNYATDIEIPHTEINGKVDVSCFAYAAEDITNYFIPDFHDDYGNNAFQIEKYDVLAIDDGVVFTAIHDENEDNKVDSIFLIIRDEQATDGLMKVEYLAAGSRKIIIRLPATQYSEYEKMKNTEKHQPFFFSLFIIPALSYALGALQASGEDIDDLCGNYLWFESICQAWERKYGAKMSDENFHQSPLEIAQALIDYPIVKAIDTYFAIANYRFMEDSADE